MTEQNHPAVQWSNDANCPPDAAYQQAAINGEAAPLFEARRLCKRYHNKTALAGVNFALPRGRIIGLLGPNGSGKTTLLKLACGLIVPSEGELLINGRAPDVETKKIVAYLPEKTYLNDWMRVRDLIDMFDDFYADFNRERAFALVRDLHISEQARLKTLSKGTQEKIQLILVMSREAELYLLDEPIGGVDPAAREYIINTILGNYNENATVLISTHLINDVEAILDDVIFLREGSIYLNSSVDTLREQSGKSLDAIFREVFRC